MPALAQFDTGHEIGIWLPIALADIYTVMLAAAGVKQIPQLAEVVRGWELPTLAEALTAKTAPHKKGGIYGADIARMFAKELK